MTEIIELTEKYAEEVDKLDRTIFPKSPWGLDCFKNNMINDFDHPVAAIKDGKAVGYGILRQIDVGEILVIGVDEAERRKGIGGMILDKLLSIASPGENVFLEVRDSNEAAKKLYEKKGFAEVARRRNYYKDPAEDAVIMMV